MSKINIKKKILEGYSGNEPWSLGGIDRIHRHFKNKISKKDIKKILAESKVYTSYKKYIKPKKFSPIYVYSLRELWQADTVFFTHPEMIKTNSGYKYLLTIIDCFSKIAYCEPMKKNDCSTALNIFKRAVEKLGKPKKLNSDRGSEFMCQNFKKYLLENNIKHYVSYSARKAPIVERFNLTIQNLLYKLMSVNHTYAWTEYLDQALNIYHKRFHRTIRFSPIEADKIQNEVEVRANLIKFFHGRGIKKSVPKFSVGDSVKITKHRNAFHRGYDEENTIEYFNIKKVDNKLPGKPRYYLEDSVGEPIVGAFFEDEIVLFKPGDFFDIDVIKERKKGKKKEFLITYIGYPKKFDEWISQEKMKQLDPAR